jgi:anti-anti-sigma factor
MSPEAKRSDSTLRISKRKGFTVVSFTGGDFQKSEAQELARLLEELKKSKKARIVVDLSSCQYISSEGLGTVARCWKWCHDEDNGRMAVVIPSDPSNEVRNLFEIIGLARVIGSAVRPSVDDAVTYLQNFA